MAKGSCDCCGTPNVKLTRMTAFGIETYACNACRDEDADDEEAECTNDYVADNGQFGMGA